MGRDSRYHCQFAAAAGVSSDRLPDSIWHHNAALGEVVNALRDDEGPRIVGGAVRDGLLGLAVADIDLATKLHPQQVIDRLEAAGLKAIPTGLDHGTVTAVAQGQNFEVTTLRRDVATDGRRATIAFSDDWREDAARRDFTINALYADPANGEIFDYFDGLADLAQRRVRFIGDPAQRIAEDHLRILRFFRFQGRFGGSQPDRAALDACTDAANSLMSLSRERIASELLKILMLDDPTSIVALMLEHGIFVSFLPEVENDAPQKLARLVLREKQSGLPASLPNRLCTILQDDSVAVDKVALRLKLSNKLRQDIVLRSSLDAPSAEQARAYAYRHGVSSVRDILLLKGDDSSLTASFEILANWAPPAFPLKGGQIVARGVSAGPKVSEILQNAEQKWIASGFDNAAIPAILDQLIVSGDDLTAN